MVKQTNAAPHTTLVDILGASFVKKYYLAMFIFAYLVAKQAATCQHNQATG